MGKATPLQFSQCTCSPACLMALPTHLGIEGGRLLELGPAQSLAEGVPEETCVLMHYLPRLLKQLLFIRDTYQTKNKVAGLQGVGSPMPHLSLTSHAA